MKKTVAAVLAAGALLGTAPVAEADTFYPSGSKGDMSTANVRVDVQTVSPSYGAAMPDEMPLVICRGLRRGEGEANSVAMGVEAGIPRGVALVVVYSSEWHFCPEFY